MNWGLIWQSVCSWPAAIAAFVKAIWPQLRLTLAALVGAALERFRAQNEASQQTIKDAAEVDAVQRTLRLDPSFRERLRRESGKPPGE